MSDCIEQRLRAIAALLSVSFVLVIVSPLCGAEPDSARAHQDAASWFKEYEYLIVPSLTLVGGVIIGLIVSQLKHKSAARRESQKQPSLPAAEAKPQAKSEPKPPPAKQPARPARSEAVTLLATLQREARFIDFIKEPLESYSDAQIGAAVRDVHRDCGKVLDRLFAIRSLVAEEEGAALEVPAGFDAGRYRLTGNVVGNPPFHGRLVHHGWEAGEVQLPEWSGTPQSARVIAPIEVELT